jgi:heme-degrading monooxygenase HmoA
MAIARIWRTRIDTGRSDEYQRFADKQSLAMFRAHAGFKGVIFAGAQEVRIVVTFWRDIEASRALEASPRYQKTVRDIEATGFIVGPSSVEVYALQGGALDGSIF